MDVLNAAVEPSGIAERLALIRERMAAACARAGRHAEAVTLVAVSKTHPPEAIRAAAESGIRVFGESRVQEAAAKIPRCPGGLKWHLVGHLQSNKIRRAVTLFDMIHSVDSAALLGQVQAACADAGKTLPVLLEINVAGEASKCGMGPAELPAALDAARRCPNLDVLGLMTLPPWAEDPERARLWFRALRALRDRAGREWDFPLTELSMGMSHDFEIAIEEGATYIRVGTDLFGARERPAA